MSTEELAQKAYAAYCMALFFQAPGTRDPLKHWEQMPTYEREAWIDAAKAVSDQISLATGRG